MNGPVVVGVDGSPSALAAVDAAAQEASLRGVELRVVHAFLWPAMHAPPGSSPLGPPTGGLHETVERIVADAVERARRQAPPDERAPHRQGFPKGVDAGAGIAGRPASGVARDAPRPRKPVPRGARSRTSG